MPVNKEELSQPVNSIPVFRLQSLPDNRKARSVSQQTRNVNSYKNVQIDTIGKIKYASNFANLNISLQIIL